MLRYVFLNAKSMNRIFAIYMSLFVLVGMMSSCIEFDTNSGKEPVVKVFDKYLYESEIREMLPDGLSKQDSLKRTKNYIHQWTNNQLLLQKAQLNLTEAQKDVSKEINKYRTSLLIYRYKQELVEQKLDTSVSPSAIKSYYQENQQNFKLKESIVRALFMKVPAHSPNLDNLKKWCRQLNPSTRKKLKDYGYKYAKKFFYNEKKWIALNQLKQLLPKDQNSSKIASVKNNDLVEMQDSSYYYLVYILDKKAEDQVAPLNYVRNDILGIIRNQKKIRFLNQLEEQMYNNALEKGKIKYFKN